MVSYQRTLDGLARTFAVRDIMVLREHLVRGEDANDALRVLNECPDYDMIPVPREGEIMGFLERESESLYEIERHDLVSEGTSVFDLVDILTERKRLFVLTGQSIGGYVHFSDLNNHLVKVPFFVILESLEADLAARLGPILNEVVLTEQLGTKGFRRAREKMRRLRKNQVNLNWTSALGFGQVLDLAINLKIARVNRIERDSLVEVRNRVAHATRELVERFQDVPTLARTKSVCLALLSRSHGQGL